MDEMGRRRAIYLAVLVAVEGALAACADTSAQGTRPAADATGRKPRARKPNSPSPSPSPSPVFSPVAVPSRKPIHQIKEINPAAPPNSIALTIDDGPDPEWTPKVLDLLARHHVVATFCLVGDAIREHPELAKRIAAAGHAICNHTMSHPQPFAGLSSERMIAEVTGAHREIWKTTGVTSRLFRSPGGDWSPAVLATVAENGMQPLDWDIDPRDWARPGTGAIEAELLHAKPGSILLSHDGGGDRSQTLSALTTVIPVLQSRGLTFVTL